MAAYGALTALQAALMAGAGGAKGLVAAREREKAEAERKQQEMDREFSTRLGIQTSGARPVTGALPAGYEQLGSYRGVQYAAPIPQTTAEKTQAELDALLNRTRAVGELQSQMAAEQRVAGRPALEAALKGFPKGILSEGEQQLILAGGISAADALRIANDRIEARQRRATTGGSTQTPEDIRKLINSEVGQVRRSLANATVDVPNPSENATERYRNPTIKVKLKPEEIEAQVKAYRDSRFADYGLPVPSAAPAGGGAGAGGARGGAPAAGAPAAGAPAGGTSTRGQDLTITPSGQAVPTESAAPRTGGPAGAATRPPGPLPGVDNIGSILDAMTLYGRRGEPSRLTYTTQDGRTYRF